MSCARLRENNIPSITSLNFDVNELGMVTCSTLLDSINGVDVKKKTIPGYEVTIGMISFPHEVHVL